MEFGAGFALDAAAPDMFAVASVDMFDDPRSVAAPATHPPAARGVDRCLIALPVDQRTRQFIKRWNECVM